MNKYTLSALFAIISLLYTAVQHVSADENVLTIDTDASCITSSCHADIGKNKYVHTAGADGKLCGICHTLLKKGEHRFRKIPPESGYLCAQCHSSNSAAFPELSASAQRVMDYDQDEKPHRPFAEGKCTVCHDAHGSNYTNLLQAEYPESTYQSFTVSAYALCFNTACHGSLGEAFTVARTLDLTAFRNGNRNLHYVHVNQAKGRTCEICHHPHTSRNPMLINNTFRFGNRELPIEFNKTSSGGSCKVTCHRDAPYDRYEPDYNALRSSPLPGKDATEEELKSSRERDLERQKERPGVAGMPEERDSGNENGQ